MTTHRRYCCNLCGDAIVPSTVATKEGFGVWHIHKTIVFKHPRDTECHICLACAKGVHDELLKVLPA